MLYEVALYLCGIPVIWPIRSPVIILLSGVITGRWGCGWIPQTYYNPRDRKNQGGITMKTKCCVRVSSIGDTKVKREIVRIL